MKYPKVMPLFFFKAYNPNDWKKSKDPIYTAVALYDFVAESNQEITLRAGQKLLVAPKELQPNDVRGWMLATTDGNRVGLVPYNYLRFAAVSHAAPQNVTQPSTLPQNQGTVSFITQNLRKFFFLFH